MYSAGQDINEKHIQLCIVIITMINNESNDQSDSVGDAATTTTAWHGE